MSILRYLTATVFILITLAAGAFSQRSPKPAVKNILFALHDDGKTLEPIAFVGNGKPSEIGKAVEGNNFYVYRKQNVKWVKVFDTYNYRCGF